MPNNAALKNRALKRAEQNRAALKQAAWKQTALKQTALRPLDFKRSDPGRGMAAAPARQAAARRGKEGGMIVTRQENTGGRNPDANYAPER